MSLAILFDSRSVPAVHDFAAGIAPDDTEPPTADPTQGERTGWGQPLTEAIRDGEALRAARKAAGLTQAALGKLCGASGSLVGQMERGQYPITVTFRRSARTHLGDFDGTLPPLSGGSDAAVMEPEIGLHAEPYCSECGEFHEPQARYAEPFSLAKLPELAGPVEPLARRCPWCREPLLPSEPGLCSVCAATREPATVEVLPVWPVNRPKLAVQPPLGNGKWTGPTHLDLAWNAGYLAASEQMGAAAPPKTYGRDARDAWLMGAEQAERDWEAREMERAGLMAEVDAEMSVGMAG